MPALLWSPIMRGLFLTITAVVGFALFGRLTYRTFFLDVPPASQIGTAAAVTSPFHYSFNDAGILHESGLDSESGSPYWWLDSGGKLIVASSTGSTLKGILPASDPWRARYAQTSGEDTSDGRRPQNLFRLLSRSTWENVRAEISFRILADNASESESKNESNGILLMSRYKDGENLYYAGLRVDGHAVIKKKVKGTYYTMAEKPVYQGEYRRGRNLLPKNEWLTLRMETRSDHGNVRIVLAQKNKNGAWEELLRAEDNGTYGGAPPILGSLPLGIRTDFMDVEFDDFRAENITN